MGWSAVPRHANNTAQVNAGLGAILEGDVSFYASDPTRLRVLGSHEATASDVRNVTTWVRVSLGWKERRALTVVFWKC